MRGRRPSGPEYVEQLEGSPQAKERLKVVLETIAGTCRVQEACERLGLSEPRFHQLRERVLLAALERMEPRPLGRPAHKPSPAEEEVLLLRQQLADKDLELRVAQARAELALALPNVGQVPAAAVPAAAMPAAAMPAAAVPAAAVPAAAVPAPEKKRRGRPRKHPLPLSIPTTNTITIANTTTTPRKST